MLSGAQLAGQDAPPVRRAGLGVNIVEVTADVAREASLDRAFGALVAALSPGGAAERAGVKAGDIIIELDRQEVVTWGMLPSLLLSKQPGDSVHLKIWRQRQAMEIDVVLSALAPATPSPREAATRECVEASCPACQGTMLLLGTAADEACEACMKERAGQIATCVEASVKGTGGAGTDAVASRAGGPPAEMPVAALALHDVTLDPGRVAPGGKFGINVSYASPSSAQPALLGDAVGRQGERAVRQCL